MSSYLLQCFFALTVKILLTIYDICMVRFKTRACGRWEWDETQTDGCHPSSTTPSIQRHFREIGQGRKERKIQGLPKRTRVDRSLKYWG